MGILMILRGRGVDRTNGLTEGKLFLGEVHGRGSFILRGQLGLGALDATDELEVLIVSPDDRLRRVATRAVLCLIGGSLLSSHEEDTLSLGKEVLLGHYLATLAPEDSGDVLNGLGDLLSLRVEDPPIASNSECCDGGTGLRIPEFGVVSEISHNEVNVKTCHVCFSSG